MSTLRAPVDFVRGEIGESRVKAESRVTWRASKAAGASLKGELDYNKHSGGRPRAARAARRRGSRSPAVPDTGPRWSGESRSMKAGEEEDGTLREEEEMPRLRREARRALGVVPRTAASARQTRRRRCAARRPPRTHARCRRWRPRQGGKPRTMALDVGAAAAVAARAGRPEPGGWLIPLDGPQGGAAVRAPGPARSSAPPPTATSCVRDSSISGRHAEFIARRRRLPRQRSSARPMAPTSTTSACQNADFVDNDTSGSGRTHFKFKSTCPDDVPRAIAHVPHSRVAFVPPRPAPRRAAADKLRLERMDLIQVADDEDLPHSRRRRRAGHHRQGAEDFKLILDSAEQGAAARLISFDKTGEPINLVVCAQISQAMLDVIEDIKKGVSCSPTRCRPSRRWRCSGSVRDQAPRRSSGRAGRRRGRRQHLVIDTEDVEVHLLDAVRTAIDLLNAGAQGPAQADRAVLRRHRRQHGAQGVHRRRQARPGGEHRHRHHRLRALRAGALRNLNEFTKQSNGSERTCKGTAEVTGEFQNVADELRKQYVATYELALAGGDGKFHTFQIHTDSNGLARSRTTHSSRSAGATP